ncbi:MAG: undecaprenyl-diphosphate phosphatase [Candidatus Palauibacterales bacterium]|nr:undecaprenyl-diphosphate phosphatase [Candidatus Palauibacterales bacterium]MDP2531071.1 undecaprenyl-diphosphate phosphatase [Candidatus Palauibacterales bacterium]MDP2582749.1 undecaprenyl-diphosphate phosphatase [Candidatus Palauibacterales bacterium]
MSLLHVLILGVIEGLTEFIPVSSTAQLLVGQTALHIPPSEAMTAFLIIVQIGPLVALFVYFFDDLWAILRATLGTLGEATDFGSLPDDARMGWYILIASVPALGVGILLRHSVEALFRAPLVEAAIRMLMAALLMTLAEILGKRSRDLATMNRIDALVVGLFQVLAVFPGASRSGSTISGGMLRDFDRPAAARFAFLLTAPVMLAAAGYETYKLFGMPGLGHLLPTFAVGFVAAAIVGWLSIKWLLAYLNRHSLYVFAAYCVLASIGCLGAHFLR